MKYYIILNIFLYNLFYFFKKKPINKFSHFKWLIFSQSIIFLKINK